MTSTIAKFGVAFVLAMATLLYGAVRCERPQLEAKLVDNTRTSLKKHVEGMMSRGQNWKVSFDGREGLVSGSVTSAELLKELKEKLPKIVDDANGVSGIKIELDVEQASSIKVKRPNALEVVLEGRIREQGDLDGLVQQLQGMFPSARIRSEVEVSEVAQESPWLGSVANMVPDFFGVVHQGQIIVTSDKITIRGIVPTQTQRRAIQKRLVENIPLGISHVENGIIVGLTPSTPPGLNARLYNGRLLKVSGFVGSELTKTELEKIFKNSLPDGVEMESRIVVRDNLQAADWLEGLRILMPIYWKDGVKNREVVVDGETIRFGGEVQTTEIEKQLIAKGEEAFAEADFKTNFDFNLAGSLEQTAQDILQGYAKDQALLDDEEDIKALKEFVEKTEIYFSSNKSYVRKSEGGKLYKLRDLMKKAKLQTIVLTGFADPDGNAKWNKTLAELRNKSVLSYLKSAGAPAERVENRGTISENPPEREKEESWKKRRVMLSMGQPRSYDATALVLENASSKEGLDELEASIPLDDSTRKLMEIAEKATVYFKSGSEALRPPEIKKLNTVVKAIKEHKWWNLVLVGCSDSSGDDELNKILANKRCQNVMNYFITQGVNEDRMRIGETRVIPAGGGEASYKLRRVEMKWESSGF